MATKRDLLLESADILVIDDSVESLRMLNDILAAEGYKPRPVDEPHAALDAAFAQPPSLILLDIRMPGKSGFEVCRELKEDDRTRDVPVIFISALDELEDRVQGFEVGGVDFISKPIQEAEVLARVRTHLELRYTQLNLEQLVTERTAEIVESEARYRTLVDTSNVGVFVTTPGGQILFANDALARMYDFDSPEQMIAQGTLERWRDPKDRDRLLVELQQHGKVSNFEAATVTQTGRNIHVILSAKQLGDTLSGMVTDITERIVAEQELKESEARFRAIFEQAAVGIAHVALDGTFKAINQRFCDIVGYAHEEMLARTFQAITHPDDLNIDLQNMRDLLGGKIETYSMEKRYFHKRGQLVWVNLTVSLVRRATYEPDYFVSVVEDITQRKHAEEELDLYRSHLETLLQERSAELSFAEEQIRAIFESSTLGVVMTTNDDQFLAVNKSIVDMLRSTEEEMLQRRVDDFYVDPQQRKILLDRLDEMGSVRDQSLHLLRDDGTTFFARLNSSRITVEGRSVNLAIVDDITEQIEDEQQAAVLEERERLARELHDSVTQTLYSASLLADTMPAMWDKNQSMARGNLVQLGRLLRGGLAEMRTLLFELRPAAMEDLTLGQLLEPLVEAARTRTAATVTLDVEGNCVCPPDITRTLFRIAQESLNNVAKHAEATEVSVKLACQPDGMVLSIDDNGTGFDPTERSPGHLGVGIMVERAQSIGATFKIDSSKGHGSHVSVAWQSQGKENPYG